MIGGGAPYTMLELALTIYVELKLSTAIHIHHIFSSLLRGEDSLVFGREVLKLYARSKVVHTIGSYCQRWGVVLCSDGFAFHLAIVPERTLHTFLTLKATLRGQKAFLHLVVGEVASLSIEQFLCLCLDTIKDSYRVIGRTVIVTPHHWGIVSIRTYDSNLLRISLQRQYVILILQQYNGLARHIQRQVSRFFG